MYGAVANPRRPLERIVRDGNGEYAVRAESSFVRPNRVRCMKGDASGMESRSYEGTEYADFWRGAAKAYEDRLEHFLLRRILRGGRSIADIGGGYGRLADCYLGKYETATLIEPASNLRDEARKQFGDKLRCMDGDVYHLPLQDGEMDTVLMIRLMHHLTDSAAALKELARVLQPGGKLVFNFSNKRNILRVLKKLAGGKVDPFGPQPETYQKQLYGHHPRSMRSTIEANGLIVEDVFGFGIGQTVVGKLPVLGGVLPISMTLSRLLGTAAITPFQLVVCRKG